MTSIKPHFEYFIRDEVSTQCEGHARPLSLSICPTSKKITRDDIWHKGRLHSPTYYCDIMKTVRTRHFCEARR